MLTTGTPEERINVLVKLGMGRGHAKYLVDKHDLHVRPSMRRQMVDFGYTDAEVDSKIDSILSTIVDQPAPLPATGDMWEQVIDDMMQRRRIGIARYGTPLQAHNGRDALVDAYQEALDLVVYLRQAIAERDDK